MATGCRLAPDVGGIIPTEACHWKCRHLIVGTGVNGALPVMDEVKREAERRKVALLILPSAQAIDLLKAEPKETNAVLHVTC